MINTIKILVFDDVELLDFCGPLEVFSVAGYFSDEGKLDVSTVAFKEKIIVSKSKIEIIPNKELYTVKQPKTMANISR